MKIGEAKKDKYEMTNIWWDYQFEWTVKNEYLLQQAGAQELSSADGKCAGGPH